MIFNIKIENYIYKVFVFLIFTDQHHIPKYNLAFK